MFSQSKCQNRGEGLLQSMLAQAPTQKLPRGKWSRCVSSEFPGEADADGAHAMRHAVGGSLHETAGQRLGSREYDLKN